MNDDDFKRFYSKSAFCFIRQRVWGFKEIFVGILHGLTKVCRYKLIVCLLKCFDLQDLISSKQAFSQARKKLKYEGYIALNEVWALILSFVLKPMPSWKSPKLLAQDASQQIKQELQQQNPDSVLKDKDLFNINFATAAGLSKNELIDLVFSNKPLEVIYQRLIEKINRNKIKEKSGREFKRKVKYLRKFYQSKRPVS